MTLLFRTVLASGHMGHTKARGIDLLDCRDISIACLFYLRSSRTETFNDFAEFPSCSARTHQRTFMEIAGRSGSHYGESGRANSGLFGYIQYRLPGIFFILIWCCSGPTMNRLS